MRPMRGADDAAERGQDEGMGSLTLSPPRVRGLFGLSSAIFENDYVAVERERERSRALFEQV
jgi:hypothetical protein